MNAFYFNTSGSSWHVWSRRLSVVISCALLLALFFSDFAPAFAATGVPKILNYQGRLLDSNGTLLGGTGTEYCFKFSLYDDATVGSGSKLWPSGAPSTMTVNVRNGVFNVGIGDTGAGGDTLDFNFQDNDTIFVNVEVATKVGATCAPGDGAESFENLSPRQRIHSSGYAINAGSVGGFLPAQYASGNQIPVLASGNLVLGGDDPFVNATTSNSLTFQGGGQVTGDIQFYSSANRITSGGHVTLAGGVTAASSTVTNATSTTVAILGTASTSDLIVSNGFTFRNVSGILKATAGAVAAALVDLATDVTGILGVGNGGTGWAAVQAGTLLYGNGSGALATTTQGTAGQVLSFLNGVPTWTATTTFSTGLSYSDGIVTNAGVTSITGTANQIAASGSTGDITLSLPALLSITNASSTAFSAHDYVAVGRTATTTIRGEANATSTFAGGVESSYINVTGTSATSTIAGGVNVARVNSTATSTMAGLRVTSGGLQISSLVSCSKALETDGSGNVVCGSDTGVDGVTVTTFTSSNTWTKSNYTGLTFTQVITTGSGGGGGGADSPDTTNEIVAGGGGAGGTAIEMISAASLGATETVTVGTAGTAGTNTGGNGGAGNASSFGAFHTANGGGAGTGNVTNSTGCASAAAIAAPGAGGTASGGDVNITGGSGIEGTCDVNTQKGGDGGTSYWGGGGSGGSQHSAAGSAAGTAGIAYGSGGGGATSRDTTTGAAGAVGAGGIVVTINYTSSGGDLAEWYETKDDVEAGDVVAISDESYEYDSKLGLQKSAILKKAVAGNDVVGVVSTAPYETIGYDVLSRSSHPRPIALAGRVPVKASLENGNIEAGDLLTVSSKPGVAMRSTKAGSVIGRALENVVCENVDGQEVCEVLVMVNTSYSTGALLNVALRDTGMDLDTIPSDLDMGRIILAEMLQQKRDITATSTLSEVLTDRLAAGLEVIAPRVLTNTLVVDAIEPVEKDMRIRIVEGGKFILERIASSDLTLSFGTATGTPSTALSIDDMGNAFFAGALTAPNFEVGSSETPGGITMYDRRTKRPYCIQIADGELRTIEGSCARVFASADSEILGSDSVFSDEAPVILVHGNNPSYLEIGDSYVDLGAEVVDDLDENLGYRTIVNGEDLEGHPLDTSESIAYEVIYRAIDSSGNVGEAVRLVIVGDGIKGGDTENAPEDATEETDAPNEAEPALHEIIEEVSNEIPTAQVVPAPEDAVENVGTVDTAAADEPENSPDMVTEDETT